MHAIIILQQVHLLVDNQGQQPPVILSSAEDSSPDDEAQSGSFSAQSMIYVASLKCILTILQSLWKYQGTARSVQLYNYKGCYQEIGWIVR